MKSDVIDIVAEAMFVRHTPTATRSPRCRNFVIAGDTKPMPSRCVERIASASIGLWPSSPVESDHNDGAETLPSAGCNYTADQLRNWLRVTEASIEVIEAAIAATPQSLSAALREHVVELYSTRDLTRSAIEQAEEEPARSVTLTEQLLALRNDEATIDVRITQLTAMIPTALSPHRGPLQDELLKYVPARNRTRSAIHRTIEMQHAGRRWVTATQHARPRLCTAQSGRHSRSSRRTARIARAAKKATADPDGPWSTRSTFGSLPEVSS
jgi:hypothetical protein